MRVGHEDEAIALGHLVLQLLDPRLAELDHAAALVADQVVVVVSGAEPLVPVARLADPQAADDPGVDHELESPVDRRPGDLFVLGPEPHEKLIRFNMLMSTEQLIEEGLALVRELEAPPFQVLAEDRVFALLHGIGECDCDSVSIAIVFRSGRPSQAGIGGFVMWQGFTIALREGIEAFLIVALTLSYLTRTGRRNLSRAVYAGIAVSTVTCAAAGWLFSKAVNQPLWEGILALAAAALVGSLLVYMKRVAGRMKSDIEGRLEAKASSGDPSRAFWGVFAFTLLMITREGMETALLIATALFQMKSSAVFAGLALGVLSAVAIGFLWTRLGKGVDLKTLLNVSAVFLGIFLIQLVLYGIHELSEARLFPASQAIHDATEILGPDGKIGQLLAYALAVIPTVWLAATWWKRRRATGVQAGAARTHAA